MCLPAAVRYTGSGAGSHTTTVSFTVDTGREGEAKYHFTLTGVAAHKYLVDFDMAGGTGTLYPCGVDDGSVTLPDVGDFDLMRLGYTLAGWTADRTVTDSGSPVPSGETIDPGKTVEIDGDTAFTAVWEPIRYWVTFDANSGQQPTRSQQFTYGIPQTLEPVAGMGFTAPTGTAFTGWNTEADGSGTRYGNGAQILNLTTVANDEILLYAVELGRAPGAAFLRHVRRVHADRHGA